MTGFDLGQVVVTSGVNAWLEATEARADEVMICLLRHKLSDWGDLDAEDRQANEDAVELGNRILSAYTVDDRKIWIITEADRSATTILFPEEY